MVVTRRDFLKATSAIAAALGLRSLSSQEAFGAEGAQSVVWLQAQGCTGCSVSLLNSIYYATIDDLLLNSLDLNYHPTVMAAAGDLAISAAQAALEGPGGYVLVVEGAIPMANQGRYCYLWPGMTAFEGVKEFSRKAGFILAVGTCAAYGGMPAGRPNPTGARSVESALGGTPVINIPGCPAHPDWIVGTIVHLLTYGKAPRLDNDGRPTAYFGRKIHEQCPLQKRSKAGDCALTLSEDGCLKRLGCNGRQTRSDCPKRQWNSGAAGAYGVNWCIGARNPCQGCTEPGFPDSMSPFYTEMEGR